MNSQSDIADKQSMGNTISRSIDFSDDLAPADVGGTALVDWFPRCPRGALIGMLIVFGATISVVSCCCSRSVRLLCVTVSSMSKKKSKVAEGPPPLLGRIGTSLKCGIVGLPNVG